MSRSDDATKRERVYKLAGSLTAPHRPEGYRLPNRSAITAFNLRKAASCESRYLLRRSLTALQPTPPTRKMPRQITLASRASQLAQIQTNIVLASLQDAFPASDLNNPTFATSFMATAGDKNQSQALYLIGGKALWTKELEVALKEGHVDMLVHSLKDVPTTLPEGCLLGAILERETPSTASS